MLQGVKSLLTFYIPSLFIIGRGVRRLSWQGGLGGDAKGADAKVVLEQCLAVHVSILQDW